MSWNESGNGRRPTGQGPNDLDKIARDWQRKLGSMFGGDRGSSRGGGGSTGGTILLIVVALTVWAWTGLYRVDEAERAIVLRFGEYLKTETPGLHWHLPVPIESHEIVNVGEVSTFAKSSMMLTADEAFVVLNVAIQYRRIDPVQYLFKLRNPEDSLEQVSESAIREVVGKTRLDDILRENQAIIALNIEDLAQETLNTYESGIEVVSVNLQSVEFPRQIQEAVQDAVKAREDQRTSILAAETYSNQILPIARGAAQRTIQEAEAYQAQVVADAEGEAARFDALLVEYQKAPRVTRERLYIEAVEEVYRNSSKVLLDAGGSNNMSILPIDKLIEQRNAAAAATLRQNAAGDSTNLSGLRNSAADNAPDRRARRIR
ncbi:MAG: FtsH protease activity modulator HflK [Pseudomonadota bacterium]